MSTEAWTQLVQRVDRLIAELRQTRLETKRWRARAMELEGLHLQETQPNKLAAQAQARELEKLRRERQKVLGTLDKLVAELDQVQYTIQEKEGG